jgi:hypothetical protein
MSSGTSSSVSRRRKCLPKLYRCAKAGCLTVDEEMLQDLGIIIHSSDRGIRKATFSPTLPSPSEDNSSGGEVSNADVFWEGDNIARHFRDYMAQSTNIFGKRPFLEWPYVHYLSTHSNSKGCSSLTASGLEIAIMTVTHIGASKPS